MQKVKITIEGPAGSGKSIFASLINHELVNQGVLSTLNDVEQKHLDISAIREAIYKFSNRISVEINTVQTPYQFIHSDEDII